MLILMQPTVLLDRVDLARQMLCLIYSKKYVRTTLKVTIFDEVVDYHGLTPMNDTKAVRSLLLWRTARFHHLRLLLLSADPRICVHLRRAET